MIAGMEGLEEIPVRPLSDWLSPILLTGHFVRLEPLTEQHTEGTARHADANTVAWLSRGGPAELSAQCWADHIGRLNTLPNRINWAVVVRGRGKLAGDKVTGRISYSTVLQRKGLGGKPTDLSVGCRAQAAQRAAERTLDAESKARSYA